jgi:protocatechuate 3,4-dioxygenase beta subunit
MERSSKRWSRSPSSKLWLPEPSRRTVISSLTAGGAALLLGCGRQGNSSMRDGSLGGSGGAGGSAGTGGAGGTGGSGAGAAYDAAAPGSLDAGAMGAADRMLASDGLLVAPDGSMVAVDGPGSPALACTRRSQQIVGPYPAANVQLDRSDIRSDPGDRNLVKPGVPLQIVIRVGTRGMLGCSPLKGAIVNAWQCDAGGVYASYASQGTASNQYLRGYQTTDGSGVVVFQSIYPGSYAGRCVHTHFSVRMNAAQSFPGGAFVGQLYFPDEITTSVLMQSGYTGRNRVLNAQDDFYKPDMLATVTRMGAGYVAELELAV